MNKQPAFEGHDKLWNHAWLSTVLIFVMLNTVFMESAALAYLDPGTGSFALQVIAASIVAVAFFARKFWHRITSFFTGRNTDKSDDK